MADHEGEQGVAASCSGDRMAVALIPLIADTAQDDGFDQRRIEAINGSEGFFGVEINVGHCRVERRD